MYAIVKITLGNTLVITLTRNKICASARVKHSPRILDADGEFLLSFGIIM